MASFLQTELALADSFLDIVQTTTSEERRNHNIENAQTALDNALAFKSYIDDLPESEHGNIWDQIYSVRERLNALGFLTGQDLGRGWVSKYEVAQNSGAGFNARHGKMFRRSG